MKSSKKITSAISGFLFRSILILIFVELIIMFTYFFVSRYFTNSLIDRHESILRQGLVNEIRLETNKVNFKFESVVHDILMLKNEAEDLFVNSSLYNIESMDVKFSVHENGSFYKSVDNGGGSLYYSSDTVIDKYAYDKALLTEIMDNSFKSVVDNNDLIIQVYFNSFDSMSRVYPFIDDIALIFGSNSDIGDFNFYYLADELHNPEKGYVWTPAYLDPAGQGWIVSCIVPIYNDGFLEGVIGIDIFVGTIVNSLLNLEISIESSVFIIDGRGTIIAMDEESEKILDLKELKFHVYDKEIEDTIVKPEEYNIFNHPDEAKKEVLTEMFTKDYNEEDCEVIIDGVEYYYAKCIVTETNGNLFVLTSKEKLFFNSNQIRKDTKRTVSTVMLGICILFLAIYFVLHKRIKKISLRISEPICELTEQTKLLGVSSIDVEKIKTTGIQELDILNHNFYKMTKEIKHRTEKLLVMQLEKKEADRKIETHMKEATTDALTNIFNRRKIDDVLNVEVAKSNRYRSIFSIILFDVDFFKEINDEFGHPVGDEVLIEIAYVLKSCVRITDLLARWGGDEFIVIALETNEKDAYRLGEKIRLTVEEYKFPKVGKVTTSIGIAEIEIGSDDQRSLLQKADISLYEAKKRGRNNVVRYNEIKSEVGDLS